MSVGEEYQVVKRGREYQGFEQRERWMQYHLPYHIKAAGKRGSGTENVGKKINV